MKVVHTQHMRTAVGTDSTQHTTVPHPQAGDGGRSMQTDVVRTTVNTALPKLGAGGSPHEMSGKTKGSVDADHHVRKLMNTRANVAQVGWL